jgi:chlorobactene glucosyltransferase
MNSLLSSPVLLYAAAFSVFFLILTTVNILRNRFALSPIISFNNAEAFSATDRPTISVLIPARNEEDSIERCVRSILNQARLPDQCIVLNDGSTDATGSILEELSAQNSLLNIISGSETPNGWLGKPWACHQLSQHATGDVLVFLDADVWLEPDAIQSIINVMQQTRADMLTVWPEQTLKTPAERTIIPLVYHTLVTLLPIHYSYSKPRWMPAFVYQRLAHLFVAACGQCLAFNHSAYDAIGGHTAVKSEIVEDVELAKQIRSKGMSVRMFEGVRGIHCRMYNSGEQIKQGFRKNFFAGFGYRWSLFITAALLHFWIFISPWILLPLAILADLFILAGLAIMAILLQFYQRWLLSRWFNWSSAYVITHPLGVIWFEYLGALTMLDRLRGKTVFWKERAVS